MPIVTSNCLVGARVGSVCAEQLSLVLIAGLVNTRRSHLVSCHPERTTEKGNHCSHGSLAYTSLSLYAMQNWILTMPEASQCTAAQADCHYSMSCWTYLMLECTPSKQSMKKYLVIEQPWTLVCADCCASKQCCYQLCDFGSKQQPACCRAAGPLTPLCGICNMVSG